MEKGRGSFQGHCAACHLRMDADECFARFDVTRFSNRFEASKPFELPGSSWFSVKSLTRKLKKRGSAYLVRAVPCEALRRPDAELVEVAAFEP